MASHWMAHKFTRTASNLHLGGVQSLEIDNTPVFKPTMLMLVSEQLVHYSFSKKHLYVFSQTFLTSLFW